MTQAENRKSMDLSIFNFFQKLTQLAFIKKIILFGSRARNDEEKRSDIDLAIECPTASKQDWLTILEIIEQADTLLKIDAIRIDSLSKDNLLLKKIKTEGVVVYAKK